MKQTCLFALVILVFSCTTAAGSEEDAIRITRNEFYKRTGIVLTDPVAVATDDKKIEASFSTRIFSKYVDDAGLVAHDKPVLQNDLTIVHLPSGFYVDIWHSASFAHGAASSNNGDEIDYTLGWSGDFAGMGIDAGITYIDNIALLAMPDGDIIQPYIELNKKFAVDDRNTITPFIKAAYGTPARGSARELQGLCIHAGVKHTLIFTKYLNINQKLVATFDNVAFGADRALVGTYEINPSYRFLEHPSYTMSFDLSARAIGPLVEYEGRDRELHLIGGGVAVNF